MMTNAPAAPRNRLLGLLPFTGVVLFLIAEVVVFLTGGDQGFLQATTLNAVLFLIGSSSIGNAIVHLFFAKQIAASIGWSTSPFQLEVGGANLALGVAAIVGAFFGREYWLGVIIAALVFLWVAGIGHIIEIRKRGNLSINNAGPILFLDFLIPLACLVLWILSA